VCFVDIKERKDLRSKYGIRMIPAHRLLDSDGRVVRSAAGYLDSSGFVRVLAS
jgi:thioredoxin-related protein